MYSPVLCGDGDDPEQQSDRHGDGTVHEQTALKHHNLGSLLAVQAAAAMAHTHGGRSEMLAALLGQVPADERKLI